MVAYTGTDCLPYFECTDSPCVNTGSTCEPSTVWCDLAAILETRLNGFDSVVARTATAVPFAKVARSSTQVIPVGAGGTIVDNSVTWDTVVVDNDDMVNLDLDNRFIRINRPGIWWFELYLFGSPVAVTNTNYRASIVTGTGTQIADTNTKWRPGIDSSMRAATTLTVTAAQLAVSGTINIGVIMNDSTATAGSITIGGAQLSAFWTREQP